MRPSEASAAGGGAAGGKAAGGKKLWPGARPGSSEAASTSREAGAAAARGESAAATERIAIADRMAAGDQAPEARKAADGGRDGAAAAAGRAGRADKAGRANKADKADKAGRADKAAAAAATGKAARKGKGRAARDAEVEMRVTRRGKLKPARKKGWNYPRAGYGPIRRWIPSWRIVVASILGMFGLGVAGLVGLYITTDIPTPADFALAQTTTVYYSDGETKMGTFAEYEREPVKLKDLPDHVSQAVVASEDQSFYTNSGISPRGIVRALVNNVQGKPQQGASTLTQQYVERYYLGTTKGYFGKLREAVLAVKIDRQQSKEEILENYLNTIYFGRGAYGIEMAAQKYFGVPASQLDLSQAALLSAIIPSPSSWDPAINPERAEERWNRVMRHMVQEGYITQEEADAAQFPQTIEVQASTDYQGPNGYLMTMVADELIESGEFSRDDLNQNGLKIVTTIDKEKQEAAVDAVDQLPADRPENNYVGLVSVDPRNGEIYALYGGADYLARQRNAVTQDRAQAGSTFKPFALLAAIEQDMPLGKIYSSKSPMKFGGAEIQNFDGKDRGGIDLVTATKYSVNTVFVQLNEDVGPENTREASIGAGLPEDTPGLDDTLTNVLGSASPRPIDMAKAYGTFANQGKTTTPHIVHKVEGRDGDTVFEGDTSETENYEEEQMNLLNYALRSVTTGDGTGKTAGQLGRQVAGKTGTSSGPWSAWFIGYIPQMVTVVDMYQVGPNGEEEVLTPFGEYTYGIGGGSFPAEIWLRYMKVATQDMEVEKFTNPERIPAPLTTPSPKRTATPNQQTQQPTEEVVPTEEMPTEETPTEETPSDEQTETPQDDSVSPELPTPVEPITEPDTGGGENPQPDPGQPPSAPQPNSQQGQQQGREQLSPGG
ncbi:MAG: transglycosylase domain-containing protein [Actinomycetaceae bacterium]|nr:transglycosylase domain-containing protein [Actinomycetaceae bacterium]